MPEQKHEKKIMKRPLFILIFTFLLTLVVAGAAAAQAPTPQPAAGVTDNQVNAVARQLYCPVCENIPLDVCGTAACAQWREQIRQELATGKTPDQIKQDFAKRYGDRVLAAPPPSGLNWLVYIIPPLAFLAGVYILYRAFRAWKKPPSAAQAPENPPAPVQSDPYIARIEEELRRR
jgi:cytochrome c-type biogenesis protein CcmH